MFTITNGKTMQYTVACFDYSFANDWEQDLFEQQLADIGFEAFSEGEAYIQTTLFDLPSLQTLVDATPGVAILDVHACEDANWNAAWDAEHADQELALGVHITPCCAFGAGHHETTSMMIEALLEAKEQGFFLQIFNEILCLDSSTIRFNRHNSGKNNFI